MKIRGLIAVTAIAALVIPAGMAVAQSEVSKANGGGQIMNEDQVQGAGDTIAFTVHDEAAPTGQVQYIDRTGDGTGQGQIVRHGSPTCFVVEGSVAQFEVLWNDGGQSTVYVNDGGQTDMVTVAPVGDPGCQDDEPDDTTALARGNVTVWDNQ
jgi:hypothetical protein